MAFMYRYKVILDNWGSGAPGLNLYHSTTGVADDQGDIGNFMMQLHNAYSQGASNFMTNGMRIRVDAEVTKHEVETGKLVASFVIPPPNVITANGGGSGLPRFTQAVCRHNTDKITGDTGKRVIGRSFIGPLGDTAIGSDGQLAQVALDAFNAMWGGLQDVASTCRLIVWHRPRKAGTNGPDDPGTVGAFGHVQNTVTLTSPGVLRGRRD